MGCLYLLLTYSVTSLSYFRQVELVLVAGRHVTAFNPDTGECSLVINRAEPGDVGVYSCRATNLAGRATCTANVVVVRTYRHSVPFPRLND